MSGFDLSARFFLQLAVIMLACRFVTRLGGRLLQPPVVCEMVTGVMLGPSLLGWAAPELSAYLFPKATMPVVFVVSQFALACYMFCVGLEYRTDLLAKGWRASLGVSIAGLLTPLALGGALGFWLIRNPAYFSSKATGWHAALFCGSAVAITAFPMLARIIVERGLSGTRIGTVSLGAGAFDDSCAWLLLAIVLAVFEGDRSIALAALGGGGAYVLLMTFVVRPLARKLVESRPREALGSEGFAATLIALAIAAFYTDFIRLHAVFGGFVLGAVLPRGAFADNLRAKIEPLVTAALLPLFFVYSGLNTRLGLLDSGSAWLIAGLVLLIATLGKGVACAGAARLGGFTWPESAAIGTLMNARGLMELILLNIGLERGIITPTTFTMFVIMAVVTTLAASPVFELLRSAISETAGGLRPSPASATGSRSS